LIIVGGTGIASAVPYLQDHLRRSGHDWEEGFEEKTRIRDIELVWTAKQVPFLQDVASRELKPLLLREDFQASFYTTGSSTSSEDVTDLGYEITPGRPHLQSLIMSRACDASSAGISLAVLACGPVGMADEARAAAHLAMRQGCRIKYVEESFAW
jgi:ferric-chelate reductase